MELFSLPREKISYIFSKESFSYLSRYGNLKKILYISGNKNLKKFLIFQETELSSTKLKKIPKPENQKFVMLFLIKKKNFLN